jgi:hypothetical protein
MTRQSRHWLCALVLAGTAVVAMQAELHAYLKLGVSIGISDPVALTWHVTPVRYLVNDTGVNGVNANDFQAALGRAFDRWQAVPTSSISYEFAGFTAARPGVEDGWSTLGFRNEPDQNRVLASTSFMVDDVTGAILESDIFFNSAFSWSVAAAGTAGRYDVETIALHEIGHLSGLGHSAIGETETGTSGRRVTASGSVMFPIAFGTGVVTNRELRPDDIAGIGDLYPDGDFKAKGTISGRVLKNGQGVFGAHIVAFNPATGNLIGNFTLTSDGKFTIGGLSPGPHVLRVEPLDDADLVSFIDGPVDLDFRVAFASQLVVVPNGGDSGSVTVNVVKK